MQYSLRCFTKINLNQKNCHNNVPSNLVELSSKAFKVQYFSPDVLSGFMISEVWAGCGGGANQCLYTNCSAVEPLVERNTLTHAPPNFEQRFKYKM